MCKCRDCEYAIFDETWGEYKCKFYGHVVRKPKEKENCNDFKQNEPKKG